MLSVANVPSHAANGANIPVIGLGTVFLSGAECVQVTETALSIGYRHIDTAAMYGNEVEIGNAIRSSGIARSELFITTKVSPEDIGEDNLQRSAADSLRQLKLDYVDLLVIHWPNSAIPLTVSIRALCRVKELGLTRHIGVSNFPTKLLEMAVICAADHGERLVANQCEYHPRLNQTKVLNFCRTNDIAFVSHTPLGHGRLLDDPTVVAIARRVGKTPAQVLLRWNIQQSGLVAIPKSAKPMHLVENLQVFDFELPDDDMNDLFGMASSDGRMVYPVTTPVPEWDCSTVISEISTTSPRKATQAGSCNTGDRNVSLLQDVFCQMVAATHPTIICDVGSFNGAKAIRFKRISPKTQIYAFSANKDTFESIICRQDLSGVTIEHAAVSDVDDEIEANTLINNRIKMRQQIDEFTRKNDEVPQNSIRMRSVTLDKYFRNQRDTNCSFVLWIDTEGDVDRVLAGAESILSRTLVVGAKIKHHPFWRQPALDPGVISRLENIGFLIVGDLHATHIGQSEILLINRNWLQSSMQIRAAVEVFVECGQKNIEIPEVLKAENEQLRLECASLQLSLARERISREFELNEISSQRNAAISEAQKWFDAATAVTDEHNPLAVMSRKRRWWPSKLALRLTGKHNKLSPRELAERAGGAGKWELAVRYYRDALDLDPFDAEIWNKLIISLRNAGKALEADLVDCKAREFMSRRPGYKLDMLRICH